MAVNPLSLTGLTPALGRESVSGPSQTNGGSFPKVLGQLFQSAAQSHESAEAGARSLALGQTNTLHEVMLQMAQADLSFHLIIEIRNRLTEAFQEIMKMQV